jgi:hypothetical protein
VVEIRTKLADGSGAAEATAVAARRAASNRAKCGMERKRVAAAGLLANR